MSLSTMRMALRPTLLRQMSPMMAALNATGSRVCVAYTSSDSSAVRARQVANGEMEQFWKRNQDRNRPVAPWIIFKPQLPMILSLQHRITGVTMGVAMYLAAIGLVAVPYDFTTLMNMLKSVELNGGILFSLRLLLSYVLVYHSLNGARHLAWDAGKGYKLTEQYKTGYLVQGTALASSITLAALPFFS